MDRGGARPPHQVRADRADRHEQQAMADRAAVREAERDAGEPDHRERDKRGDDECVWQLVDARHTNFHEHEAGEVKGGARQQPARKLGDRLLDLLGGFPRTHKPDAHLDDRARRFGA